MGDGKNYINIWSEKTTNHYRENHGILTLHESGNPENQQITLAANDSSTSRDKSKITVWVSYGDLSNGEVFLYRVSIAQTEWRDAEKLNVC